MQTTQIASVCSFALFTRLFNLERFTADKKVLRVFIDTNEYKYFGSQPPAEDVDLSIANNDKMCIFIRKRMSFPRGHGAWWWTGDEGGQELTGGRDRLGR